MYVGLRDVLDAGKMTHEVELDRGHVRRLRLPFELHGPFHYSPRPETQMPFTFAPAFFPPFGVRSWGLVMYTSPSFLGNPGRALSPA